MSIAREPVYLAKYAVLGVLVGAAIAIYLKLFYLLDDAFGAIRGSLEPGFGLGTFISVAAGLAAALYLAVRYSVTGVPGSGTHYILSSLHLKDGRMSLRDTLVKPAASALTIAAGGSAGLEGPSLVLGGGLGSALYKVFGEDRKTTMLSGAAAGLSAVFRAPLTGILFSLEIPFRKDIYKEVFIEASMASVVSYLVINTLLGGEKVFVLEKALPAESRLEVIGASIIIGLVAAAASVLYAILYDYAEETIHGFTIRNNRNMLLAPIMAGIILAAIYKMYPEAMGVGYDFMSKLYRGEAGYGILILVGIFMAKLAATITTFSLGGSGGLFIPAIFMGSVLGYATGLALGIDPAASAMIGAAALLAGSHKILLAPVAFIAETVGAAEVIPALVASTIAYFLSGDYSLYSHQPPRRIVEAEMALDRLIHMLPPRVLRLARRIRVRSVMVTSPVRLTSQMTVSEAIGFFARYPYRMLPVVDEEGRLIGVTSLESLIAIEEEEGHRKLGEIELEEPLRASPEEDIIGLAYRMLAEDKDHAYVVDEDGKLIGVLTSIDIVRILVRLLPLHLYAAWR